jgi:Flp pilus assembly protein TadB
MSNRDPNEKKPSRSDKSKDRPANASKLKRAQIRLERERNSVRREQEGLKDRRMRRWGFAVGLGLVVFIVATAVAGIVVAVIRGDLPAASLVPVLPGAIGIVFFVLKKFSDAIKDPADAESAPPE